MSLRRVLAWLIGRRHSPRDAKPELDLKLPELDAGVDQLRRTRQDELDNEEISKLRRRYPKIEARTRNLVEAFTRTEAALQGARSPAPNRRPRGRR